jgi:hypothetical protein
VLGAISFAYFREATEMTFKMIHVWWSVRSVKLFATIALATCLLGNLWAAEAWAQKGKGGTPPAGELFYQYGNSLFRMRADGTAKTSCAVNGLPSRRTYGTGAAAHRWFISPVFVQSVTHPSGGDLDFYDLFAFAVDASGALIHSIRLTDFTSAIVNNEWPNLLLPMEASEYSWSNDQDHTFMSFAARDFGTNKWLDSEHDFSDDVTCVFRLHVSVADLEAALALGITNFDHTATSPDLECALSIPMQAYLHQPKFHHWSPMGQLLYRMDDGLWIAEPLGETVYHVPGQSNPRLLPNTADVGAAQWSPNGLKIAYNRPGALWTVNPNGTGATAIVSAGNTQRISGGVAWSPDSQHVFFGHSSYKGLAWQYHLARVPATGGSVTELAGDLTAATGKRAVSWVQVP